MHVKLKIVSHMMFNKHIMPRNTNEGARYLWSRCHGGRGHTWGCSEILIEFIILMLARWNIIRREIENFCELIWVGVTCYWKSWNFCELIFKGCICDAYGCVYYVIVYTETAFRRPLAACATEYLKILLEILGISNHMIVATCSCIEIQKILKKKLKSR